MNRRDFLAKGVGASVVAGVSMSSSFWVEDANAATGANSLLQLPDLVAIKGGEPEIMFEKGIAALGGMKTFVKKGQSVVVKPNIGWDAAPNMAANTHPGLVGKIIEHCFRAGAKNVFVFDHTCDNASMCYANSGIEAVVAKAGGKMIAGNAEAMYREVTVSKGVKLKTAKVHELILDCDVFINVPVLKSHGGASLTMSMKNLMGIVWDRRFWHKNDLHQCIADLPTWRQPDLNIIDAYRVMMKNGPRGVSEDDVSLMKAQIISKDMVAADTAAAKMFGLNPTLIGHIVKANEHGFGTMKLENLKITKLTI